MRKKILQIAVFFLAALIIPLSLAELDPVEKSAQLEKLREEISKLKNNLSHDEGRQGALRKNLESIELKAGGLAKSLRKLDRELESKSQRLLVLEREKEEHLVALDEHRDTLSKQIVSAYAMGRQEYLKMILNQRDPATVARTFVYYDYLNKARSRKIRVVIEHLDQVAMLEKKIEQQISLIKPVRERNLAEKRRLEKVKELREGVLAELNKKIDRQGNRLKILSDDEKKLEKLVYQLQEVLLDIPDDLGQKESFKSLKGKMPWPAKGAVTRSSARHASGLHGRVWRGVVIRADEGDEVAAVAGGRILFADWFRGLGLLVIIDHGDGYMSLYGHNQGVLVSPGEWVQSGAVIALAGNSGGRKDTGVYFEIRASGEPVDPFRWCRKHKS